MTIHNNPPGEEHKTKIISKGSSELKSPKNHFTFSIYKTLRFNNYFTLILFIKALIEYIVNYGRNIKLRLTNIKLEGTNIKLEHTNIKLESTNIKLEPANIKLEGANIKLEDTNIKLEGTNIKLEGTNIKLEGTNKLLRGSRIHLCIIYIKIIRSNLILTVINTKEFIKHFFNRQYFILLMILKHKGAIFRQSLNEINYNIREEIDFRVFVKIN